ncbi:hypothetical protein INT45_012783 [Circinella minor]|uniref:Uncharacterized protein n=1 Tax=Circinella minor TaxID=1195481 RepID=A0A8H7VIM1_9FUNG|nr:hypothetical protein INT45_012783 [Circinella minor]
MPVQIVAPCPKRPTSSSSTSTHNIYNNNQEIQDACHQELRQILNSNIKQANHPINILNNTTTTTTTMNNTTSCQLPEVSEQQIIPRTDNPLPQDMSFFTTTIQPYLPSTKTYHHRPRSYSVGDNSYYIYVKKNNDLVH